MSDPAARRFAMLAAVRFGGVALALLGATLIARRWLEPAELFGGAALFTGAFGVLIAPQLLVRSWRGRR